MSEGAALLDNCPATIQQDLDYETISRLVEQLEAAGATCTSAGLDEADGNEKPSENGDGTRLEWIIKRAVFKFEDQSDYEKWKTSPEIYFEFAPNQSSDGGQSIFADPESIGLYEKIDDTNGSVSISFDDEAPTVTASFIVTVSDRISEEALEQWSSEEAGWMSSTISLGDYVAYVSMDDGGEWRLASEGNAGPAENSEQPSRSPGGASSNSAEIFQPSEDWRTNAGWEERDGRTICRWIIVWQAISENEIAGCVGGYSGGGGFQLEQFYGRHSREFSSLMIDIEDKVTGEEIDFYSDVAASIREISDRCQDAAMAYHDEDEWYEVEQLLLKDSAKMFADQKDDMFLISEQTPFAKTVLEAIGVTALPADSDSAVVTPAKAPSGELDDLKEIFFDMEDMLMEKSVLLLWRRKV